MTITSDLAEWLPIKTWDKLYEVSTAGQVRSVVSGRLLKFETLKGGHERVKLQHRGKSIKVLVHRLVAQAFIPNPEDLPIVRHLDDVPNNNSVNNLAWGTHSDNFEDAKVNGKRKPKTHCINGHEYTEENTYRSAGKRWCRVCRNETQRRYNGTRNRLG